MAKNTKQTSAKVATKARLFATDVLLLEQSLSLDRRFHRLVKSNTI